MATFVDSIEELTLKNETFRTVLVTNKFSQLVVMALNPGEDIGMEVHEDVDQFLRIEKGEGEVSLDGVVTNVREGSAIVIPAGVKHNLTNTSEVVMKLYTVYSPPNHPDGTIHKTKTEAMAAEED